MRTIANKLRPRYLWTVADCHKMTKTDLLAAGSRVGLIEGEVIKMAPIGSKFPRLIVYRFAGLAGILAHRTHSARYKI